jgi:hypothetical protein
MNGPSEPKPVVDAVTDAIGALSELLRSLRARARQASKRAKSEPRTVKGRVKKTARTAVRKGKSAARTAKAAGVAFVRGAESALRDLTEPPAQDAKRSSRRTG